MRYGTILEQLDQERPRDVQNLSGLYGREFGVLGDDGDPPPCCHRLEDLHEQRYGARRKLDRLHLLGVRHTKLQRRARLGEA